jgi:hypothetical protein
MLTYTIKKNGYSIGQARGKAEAVKRIMLETAGMVSKWQTVPGEDGPRCISGGSVYTMEIERDIMNPDLNMINLLADDTLLNSKELAKCLNYTGAGALQAMKQGKIEAIQILGKWYVTGKAVKNVVKGVAHA